MNSRQRTGMSFQEMTDEELLVEYYKLQEPLFIGGAEAVARANARAHLLMQEVRKRGLLR